MITLLSNAWTKSSRCGADQPSCVEVALAPLGGVGVRDSKSPEVLPLWFTEEAWAAFIGGAKDGEFDLA